MPVMPAVCALITILAAARSRAVVSWCRFRTRPGVILGPAGRALPQLGYAPPLLAAAFHPAVIGPPDLVAVLLGVAVGAALALAAVDLRRYALQRAGTDQLTGLPNRRALRRAVAARRGSGHRSGALLVIELHGLAGVIDLRGPIAYQAVLVEAALRLRAQLGPEEVPARLAGSQLAVVTLGGPVEAYGLGIRLLAALTRPYQLPDRPVHLPASVGIAGLAAGADADDVVRRAARALRRAGRLGRGRIEWYEEQEKRLARRLYLERHLPGAAGRGELALVYQPVVELDCQRPVGVEVLLRWLHPFFGTVLPAELLPIADQQPVRVEIRDWVLHTACRQAAAWRRDGHDLWLAVNVSVRQLTADFVPEVAAALSVHRLPPERLTIELSAAELSAAELSTGGRPAGGSGTAGPAIASQLGRLRALGIRTGLGGFRAGQTDPAWLRRLPLDLVKLAPPPAGEATMTAAADRARRLGLVVVAERLETADQLAAARAAGCRYGQGFQLAHPAPADRIGTYLAGRADHPAPAR